MAVHFFPEVNIGGTGSLDDYIALIEKGSANGVATLDSTSKIPSSQLPNISITDTFVVGSQSALLALTAQVGDVAIRTDLNKSFILQSEPASVLGNWLELLTPPDSVLSVDGRTGVVNLSDRYQALSNELSGISSLVDTPGFIKKTGDGTYTIDANSYLTANQTITLSGDVTGSGASSINVSIPSIPWSKINPKPTTLGGYGITDAYTKLEIDGSLSNKQNLSNELSGISSLVDTPGFIKKTGDGAYSIDTNTYLTNNQTITLSGDATGSGTTSINVTLPNIVTAGSSAKPTYNAKGLVTGSGSLVASDIPLLDATKVTGVVDITSTQSITGSKTFSNGVVSGNLTIGGTSQQAKLVVNRLNGNIVHPTLDANTAIAITSGGGTDASGASISFIGGNNSSTSIWFGDVDNATTGAVTYLHTNETLSLRTGGANRANINSSIFSIPISTPSTSTTTGALVVSGGVGCQALFATSLNGQLVLNRFTTATRPVASVNTLGQVWLNTDTGKIEYVATASTIQSITSA